MLLRRFAYHRPTTVADAIGMQGEWGEEATYYAGGTELLLAMKMGFLRYSHLIDLKRIPGLDGVARLDDGRLAVGALTTHHALARDPAIAAHLPGYAALARGVANIRVRVTGTIGGNLCFGEPHADPPTMLSALNAAVELTGSGGTREVPLADFQQGAFETDRRDDEVLTRILVPCPGPDSGTAYARFAHGERPAVGAAAVLKTDPARRTIASARVWVGAVTDRPSPAAAVEDTLAGIACDAIADTLAPTAAVAAEALDIEGDAHNSADYKRHLAAVFITRSVKAALAAVASGQED